MAVSPFEKAKVRLVIQEPFFATLLLGMQHVEGETLPDGSPLWLAATNGETLWFNPVNANKLPLDQCVGLIKHELMHVALMHNFRIGSRDHGTWNKATDYIINDTILAEGGALPEGGLHDPVRFGRDKSEEEVYGLLPPPQKKGKGEGEGEGEGDGEGKGKSGKHGGNDPFHNDLMPAPDKSPEAQQKAMGRVVRAAQVAKAMGKLPAFIESAIGEMLDPVVSWEQELAEFLTEISRNDYSFARPNRRFVYQNLYLPSAYSQDAMGRLVVVLDESGSVSLDEHTRFVSELMGAIEGVFPLALDIVHCDSEVSRVDSFEHPTMDSVLESMKRSGCGGTDMTVALDYIDEHIEDVKACIVFTDGGTPFGHERDYPTLWAITEKGVQADMGRTVYVPA